MYVNDTCTPKRFSNPFDCVYVCICILCSKESQDAVQSLHELLLKQSGLISKDPQHFLKALSSVDHNTHACGVVVILWVARDSLLSCSCAISTSVVELTIGRLPLEVWAGILWQESGRLSSNPLNTYSHPACNSSLRSRANKAGEHVVLMNNQFHWQKRWIILK